MTKLAIKDIRRTIYRGKKGSIAFGTVLAFILVILGVGFMVMMLYMGGQNETKNAVDAGALNIAKLIIDNAKTTLGLLSDNERIFYDVTAKDPNKIIPSFKTDVTMRNINRVWAKALLIGINADAAGENVGTGKDNAQKAIDGAEKLSDELQKEVLDTTQWQGWFSQVAQQNSVRMLGKDASLTPLPGSNWQSSCMMRGAESNVELVGDEQSNFTLPPGYTLNSDFYTKSTRVPAPPGSEGRFFLKGYTPITVADKTVWQIPFPYDEITHGVSGPKFNAEKPETEKLEWNKPIPNAFSAEGAALRSSGSPGQKAVSYVISNPHQPFRMSIPHSFLKLHVDDPVAVWLFWGPPLFDKFVNFGDDTPYTFKDPSQTLTGPTMPLGGILCATASSGDVNDIGLDVFLRPLDDLLFPALFSFSDNDKSDLEAIMVNRINEMCSDPGTPKDPPKALTAADLHKCLGGLSLNSAINVAALVAGERDFIIYSTDGKTVECQPTKLAKIEALVKAPWLLLEEGNLNMIDNDPDGAPEKQVVHDASLDFTLVDAMNGSSTPIPFPPCTTLFDIGWATYDEDVFWTPGSGYNGCLGTIRLHRSTRVHSLSVSVPVL